VLLARSRVPRGLPRLGSDPPLVRIRSTPGDHPSTSVTQLILSQTLVNRPQPWVSDPNGTRSRGVGSRPSDELIQPPEPRRGDSAPGRSHGQSGGSGAGVVHRSIRPGANATKTTKRCAPSVVSAKLLSCLLLSRWAEGRFTGGARALGVRTKRSGGISLNARRQ